ncbi:MAG: hypothetical protein LBF22_03440 [Deltaproteobacteria bacterium]|nr:hypothetical protein [Deltaproteobacteria bacterium]
MSKTDLTEFESEPVHFHSSYVTIAAIKTTTAEDDLYSFKLPNMEVSRGC